MSTQTTRKDQERNIAPPAHPEAPAASDLNARYERLLHLARRMSDALTASMDEGVEATVWESAYNEYCDTLRELKTLAEHRRPITLRPRGKRLRGDELAEEVIELFAA